ncbi:hypothetical protein HDV05_005893 [Chytridiales sp. JEL 0842]|nr:hypothetical protein HDV05_005893 [Chytridiales sp. JEL 0842]
MQRYQDLKVEGDHPSYPVTPSSTHKRTISTTTTPSFSNTLITPGSNPFLEMPIVDGFPVAAFGVDFNLFQAELESLFKSAAAPLSSPPPTPYQSGADQVKKAMFPLLDTFPPLSDTILSFPAPVFNSECQAFLHAMQTTQTTPQVPPNYTIPILDPHNNPFLDFSPPSSPAVSRSIPPLFTSAFTSSSSTPAISNLSLPPMAFSTESHMEKNGDTAPPTQTQHVVHSPTFDKEESPGRQCVSLPVSQSISSASPSSPIASVTQQCIAYVPPHSSDLLKYLEPTPSEIPTITQALEALLFQIQELSLDTDANQTNILHIRIHALIRDHRHLFGAEADDYIERGFLNTRDFEEQSSSAPYTIPHSLAEIRAAASSSSPTAGSPVRRTSRKCLNPIRKPRNPYILYQSDKYALFKNNLPLSSSAAKTSQSSIPSNLAQGGAHLVPALGTVISSLWKKEKQEVKRVYELRFQIWKAYYTAIMGPGHKEVRRKSHEIKRKNGTARR